MKPRMTTVLLFALVLLSALAAPAPSGADAQVAPGPFRCPTIVVSCPDRPAAGGPVRFTANITASDPSVTPTLKWGVTGGKIISGQGTYEVVVEAEGRNTLTATVEVGGYASSCRTSASCTMTVHYARVYRKADEYGDIKPKEEKRRLGGFAQELRNDPTAEGYVIVYAGRRARRGEAQERGEKARNYLVGAWGLDPARIVVIDGGHREGRAVELFSVPPGASPPPATPTVEPSEAEIVGGRGKE